jgi:hypothetical protein
MTIGVGGLETSSTALQWDSVVVGDELLMNLNLHAGSF